MRRVALVFAGAALVWACTEQLTAPGVCPEYCPGGRLEVIDTLLIESLGRDTAFRGYVRPHEAVALPVVTHPSVTSRAVLKTLGIPDTMVWGDGDPTPYPVRGVDSVRLEFMIVRPDTTPRNLTLQFYRLPKTIDSTTSFAEVAGSFVPESLARAVNINELLGRAASFDTVLRDSVRIDPVTGDLLRVDRIMERIVVRLKLDSAQVPYVPADSGVLAFGVAATADSQASAMLGSLRGPGTAARLTWFFRFDSTGGTTVPFDRSAAAGFDAFVVDPPPAALDSTLAVGGAPSSRSVLRVDLPRRLRDSTQVIRATLRLAPAQPAAGTTADSFLVAAFRVQVDFGAKSPPAVARFAGDSSHVAAVWVRPGVNDTLRIEVTRLVRYWSADTTAPTTFLLLQLTPAGQLAEGAWPGELRFEPSTAGDARPTLELTYVPRVRLGVP